MSDVEHLAQVAQGDEAARRELVERHSAWLLLRLMRRTSDEDLALEAMHDTFVAVWRNPRSYRGDGPVGAWSWAVAIRQLVSRLRKRAPLPIAAQVISRRWLRLVRSAEDGHAGAALALWSRGRGEGTPGLRIATVVVPVAKPVGSWPRRWPCSQSSVRSLRSVGGGPDPIPLLVGRALGTSADPSRE